MNDCPKCEYNKNRAARWRAEAYKQGGHDVIELPWVDLTDEEMRECNMDGDFMVDREKAKLNVQAKLKEKNT